MNLQQWLEHVGLAEAAQKLNIPYRTVCSWRYRESVPRAETLRKIVKASGGKCSYESLINGK